MFSLSFIYSGKLFNIEYLWVAKVCESLVLAVKLKVKIELICAEVFSVSEMIIKCQYITFIYSKNWGLIYKVCIRTNLILERVYV